MWANLDPSSANSALMSLLDSTPSSKAFFDAGLNESGFGALTTDDTPSENWPYGQNTIPGGDNPLIGKLLAISTPDQRPQPDGGDLAARGHRSHLVGLDGCPAGVPWNLMTAAIQNANGQFVAPSTDGGASGRLPCHPGGHVRSDDRQPRHLQCQTPLMRTAYNSFLMEESYLVVPTNGLSADKAGHWPSSSDSPWVRRARRTSRPFGAAPATSAMVTAGLKVAAQLDAESVSVSRPGERGHSIGHHHDHDRTGHRCRDARRRGRVIGRYGHRVRSSGSSDSPGLAFTGAPDLSGCWSAAGAGLILVGSLARRRLRQRGVR